MKSLNTTLIAALTLALTPVGEQVHAHSGPQALSADDIETVRQNLQSHFQDSKKQLLERAGKGYVLRTCGAGSHGGDGDPV